MQMKMMRWAVIALVSVMVVGCASRDGRIHTPFTGVSVHKAYALAEADGWVRVDEAPGERMWVQRDILTPLNEKALTGATAQERMVAAAERVLLAQTTGKTDAQIVRAYNPTGKVVAQAGDGLLATALAGGLAWGVSEINNNGDNSGNSTVNNTVAPQDRHDVASATIGSVTAGDNSPVAVNVNISYASE
jgi:hypothetical protein